MNYNLELMSYWKIIWLIEYNLSMSKMLDNLFPVLVDRKPLTMEYKIKVKTKHMLHSHVFVDQESSSFFLV